MTHGHEIRRNSINPTGEKSLKMSPHLLEMESHKIVMAKGKTIPINPFVKKARALPT